MCHRQTSTPSSPSSRRAFSALLASRYWMLETIREYAGERLEEESAARELRGGHAAYYLSLAEHSQAEDSALVLRRLGPRARQHESSSLVVEEDHESECELRLVS